MKVSASPYNAANTMINPTKACKPKVPVHGITPTKMSSNPISPTYLLVMMSVLFSPKV
jgi:hypothetical protein